jgi:hypothetical protein
MPDPYRKYAKGDAIPRDADTFSAFADGARLARDTGQILSASDLLQTRDADIIRVKNESGTALGRGSILCLGDPIFLPSASFDAFLREVAYRGVDPTFALRHKFVVLLEGAPVDRVVRAFLSGVCPVEIDITDTSHGYAIAVAGDKAKLKSSGDGPAEILWQESGTGTKRAIIRIGPTTSEPKLAYVTGGSIAAVSVSKIQSSGTCRLWEVNSSDTEINTGIDVTARNPSTAMIANNSKVIVQRIAGKWTITQKLDC